MTTIARRPSGTPTYDAFRARLEPELSIDDLDTRARNAAAIVTRALADGDAALAVKAFKRMVERWEQREALRSAPEWLWKQRHETVSGMFESVEDSHPVAEAVTMQFYITLARVDGMDREEAEAYGWRQTRQWFRTEAGA